MATGAMAKLLAEAGHKPSGEVSKPVTEPAAIEGDQSEGQQQQQPDDSQQQQQQQPDNTSQANAPVTVSDEDIADDVLLRALEKRGHKLSAIDELGNLTKPKPAEPTEEEKREAEQARQDQIRQFALKTKKATSTQFDSYAMETNIPVVELAYKLYKDERIAELKAAKTPEAEMPDENALRDEFDTAHYQFADENDPKRKRAEKLLKGEVDDYLNNKYASIIDLEEDFTAHEEETKTKAGYTNLVKEVASSVPRELEFSIAEGKDVSFPVKFKITDQDIAEAQAAYLSEANYHALGKSGISKEALSKAVINHVMLKQMNNIITEAARTYGQKVLDEAAKGRRGILPVRNEGGSAGGATKVRSAALEATLGSPEAKKILNK